MNYVSGLKAWHTLHRMNWIVNQAELEILLRASAKVAPARLKKTKRTPWTVEIIKKLHAALDFSNHSHVAVFACLTTGFYAAARLGELTVPNLTGFIPDKHPKTSDIRTVLDHHGNASTIIHIPSTKSSKISGEDIYWTEQTGITDPKVALEKHLVFNNPPMDSHLFAYPHLKDGYRPLSRQTFLNVISATAKRAGLDPLHGHGLRIGATLEYLLRGLSFEAMKVKGRWASDAFTAYLTNHAEILAQHTHAGTELHNSISQITIPRLRRQ